MQRTQFLLTHRNKTRSSNCLNFKLSLQQEEPAEKRINYFEEALNQQNLPGFETEDICSFFSCPTTDAVQQQQNNYSISEPLDGQAINPSPIVHHDGEIVQVINSLRLTLCLLKVYGFK